jgi:hypothetical protein
VTSGDAQPADASPGCRAASGVTSSAENWPGSNPHLGGGNLLTQFSDKSGRTFGE